MMCPRFSDVYWLDASSEATIELGLMQIAQAKEAPEEAKKSPGSALQWISQASKWLMVYDGADGGYSVVENLLPPGNEGNILFTSRNAGLKRLALDLVNVLDMTDDEAVSLLMKSSMLDGSSDHIQNMARQVVSELGGIPLALDQAGSYIQSCGCEIEDYLELYKKHKHQLMSKKEFKGASGYGKSTYGTWDISMQEIESMATKGTGEEVEGAQSAIRLLRLFAFLNHENIPQELFRNAAENYMQSSKGENEEYEETNSSFSMKFLDHQTLFLSKNGEWEKMQFLGGIKVLLSFSLIKTLNHLYSMHLLVSTWSRSCIPETQIGDHFHRARAVLATSIVLDSYIDNYALCTLLAPHIRANSLHAIEFGLPGKYYGSEYDKFALVFHRVGSWNEAEKILDEAIDERKKLLGPDHPATIDTMRGLAATYFEQGRWDEAEKLQVDVMDLRKAQLGPDHLDTLSVMHDLASTYLNQGRWVEAEKLQVEVMNARKEKLGPEHPSTLITMDNLASTYLFQGKWNEAEKLQVHVMKLNEAKFGSEHPITLVTMHNLASTYWQQGKWDEAERLFEAVMSTRKAINGTDHPDTVITMNNLALTYQDLGKLDKAEKIQVDLINISKAKVGPDHPQTLSAMHNLASIYQLQERWEEAEKLQVEVINVRKAKLGSDHPDTLVNIDGLTYTYQHLGRLDEAEKLQMDVVNASKAKLGPDHPDTLTAMHNLASIYKDMGKFDEAEKIQTNVITTRKTKLGPDHPNTLATMASLEMTYKSQGRWDEAEHLLSDTIQTMKQILGPQHPTTLDYVEHLEDLKQEAQKKVESEVYHTDRLF